jgi:putative transcriptional regulator
VAVLLALLLSGVTDVPTVGAEARSSASLPVRQSQTPPVVDSLAGQLLVAAPRMSDPRFVHTVIYVAQHGPTGAMGVVVNRPVAEVPLARLLESLGIEGHGASAIIRVHYGGPVDPARGLVIHSTDYVGDGTLIVEGDIALTQDPEVLRAMAAGKGPRQSLFALGYAGWAPGQLEAEIEAGAWITIAADEALVFGPDDDEKWQRAIARRRIRL